VWFLRVASAPLTIQTLAYLSAFRVAHRVQPVQRIAQRASQVAPAMLALVVLTSPHHAMYNTDIAFAPAAIGTTLRRR
jgi:hypothetical protein